MSFINEISALTLALAVLGAPACKSEDAAPALAQKRADRLSLTKVASGLKQPVFLTAPPKADGRLYVIEQPGRVQMLDVAGAKVGTFVDLTARVQSSGSERGLLGMAFHPRYPEDPRVFLAFTATDADGTQRNVVSAFTADAERGVLDDKSERVLLSIEDPAANHNGGMIAFGPDGYLYVGTGDGGGAGDRFKTSRDPKSLLAKMLRIDVNGSSHERPYGVPTDNPFVGRDDVRPEVWATGLRNPWRFSFDRARGDLFIGDVGQNKYEEVSFQPRESKGGEDYGWNVMEANHCFSPESGCNTEGLVTPLVEYAHSVGCSVTGGYVYRGSKVKSLQGSYLYSDYCSGEIWVLEAIPDAPPNAAPRERFRAPAVMHRAKMRVSSFGEDSAGELYVVDHAGAIYRVDGFAPAPQ